MGLYKLCEHKGRARDRCEHAWWARFRQVRVSLEKWSNREITTKTEAEAIFDDLKKAVRAGTFENRRAEPEHKITALTFRQFAHIYKERHVFAKKLAIGKTIDYRLKPIIEYFGDRPLAEIRTADVEDFIADLRKPRIAGRRKTPRVLAPASINRTIEILRHMMNWAVGREYIDRTPFRRGTETLDRKLREDNQRRRRVDENEEARIIAVAPPLLRSMIIAALDTGMRQGEMLALRFKDVDLVRGLITLRGETTKSQLTRLVPIATARLRAVLEWLELDADGGRKPADALVFSDEAGEPVGRFRTRSSGASTCAGTTCGTSTPHGSSRRTSLWRRCATSSATRLSPQPNATTTRGSRTCRLQRLVWSAARHSRRRPPSRSRPKYERAIAGRAASVAHRQIVKISSRVGVISTLRQAQTESEKRALTLTLIRI